MVDGMTPTVECAARGLRGSSSHENPEDERPRLPLQETMESLPQKGMPSDVDLSGTETPCQIAAAIIAISKGDVDDSRAYEALGCSERRSCMVKNVHIFDLMD